MFANPISKLLRTKCTFPLIREDAEAQRNGPVCEEAGLNSRCHPGLSMTPYILHCSFTLRPLSGEMPSESPKEEWINKNASREQELVALQGDAAH